MIKQLREEMRSRKIFFLVPVYIAILSTIAIVSVSSNTNTGYNPVTLSSNAKVTLFVFIVAVSILLGLIGLILGAASFTTEKERATYELLELTPMTYVQLILGKFFHSYIVIALILFSSLPVFSTLFFMGGLSYLDLILPMIYLFLFFAVVILGAICISIASNRTIIGIILSLLVGFVSYISLAFMGVGAFRQEEDMGFAVVSPWLVAWRQIFQPVPLRLYHFNVPVWIVYCAIYLLLALLLISWGHNALDTRKHQRNARARILGMVLLNLYVAVGVLCVNAFHAVTAKEIEDFYQFLMAILIATLPFFVVGVFTDQDIRNFRQKPLQQTFHIRNLFLNHPATGPFYLITLLASISVTLNLCTSVASGLVYGGMFVLLLWIGPWILLFLAMRLSGIQARGIFISYILGILLVTLIATFYHSGKSTSTIFDFFLIVPVIAFLYVATLIAFIVASVRASRRLQRIT
jgi:ABC-2 type transport system permease protein